MSVDFDVPYFRQRISLLTHGLRQRFDELESRDFPSEVPSQLIELVEAILRLLEKKIETADEKLLPLVFDLLRMYQQLLEFVDNAHTEQAPLGLVSIVKVLLEGVSPGARFFVSPRADDYNYSILDITPFIVQSLKNLLSLSELAQLPTVSNSPFYLITFPRAERDNALVHAVFGHEVGHIVTGWHLEREAMTPEFSVAVQETMNKAIPLVTSPGTTLQIRQKLDLQKELTDLRRRAMEELLSDYVGVLIFGPSALFAAYEIFSLENLDTVPKKPQFYPPNRYRYRLQYNALKEEGFIDAVEQLAKDPATEKYFSKGAALLRRLETIILADDDEKNICADPVVDVAYGWVKDSLTRAKADVKAAIPAHLLYSPDCFVREAPQLIERLALCIPPNELGTYPKVEIPAWQSALASTWFYRICGERFVAGKNEQLSLIDLIAVNRFCLRAVESIALQLDYQKHLSKVETTS